jgi:hypothetical protein
MKAKEKKDFHHYDVEVIRHYNICDCLDLFRKIQFRGALKTPAQKKLVASLETRIINLVMPGDGASSSSQLSPRST